MIRISEIKLPLGELPAEEGAHPESALRCAAARILQVDAAAVAALHVHKRSFDARKAELFAVYIVDIEIENESQVLSRLEGTPHVASTPDSSWRAPVRFDAPPELRPIVVGFGPCGIFAALVLAQMGLRPIVLERGKAVRERTKDTWGLWRKRELQPESNVQFGEGGAGTFSDGKLYSQIKDPRHLGRKVMSEFVKAGAPGEILYVAHPHIGTFKLVKVVENMRAEIERLGGEVRFQQRVADLRIEDGQVRGVVLPDGSELRADHVVLALGHSARDTFEALHARGVFLEAKPFSIGFRIEHPQGVIDRARWGRHAGHALLGAADYKLVHHASNGRSVYSFCMCPGGTVVAATSERERVVTNGMSQYSRSERNANAGIVVGVEPERDYPGGPLAGVALQRELESRAYLLGGENYDAPGQLVGDFLAGRSSSEFGGVIPSYQPGVKLGDLHAALPAFAIAAMREALPAFGRKIKGYDMPDAVLTGVETRTSSPLRITRGENLQSLNVKGLYPAGEGAGYAGGILSAGVDGIRVGEAVALAIASSSAQPRSQ